MQNIFTKAFDLRTSDFDCHKRMLPSSVLDLFQVVAGEHADSLGCGINDLIKANLLWVLLRTKYQIIRQPNMFQRVIVKTWPLVPSKISFQREYLIEDEQGATLIKGSSEWAVIHSEKRRIVAASNIYPTEMIFLTEKTFEEKSLKISDFDAKEDGFEVCPGFSQLDINGHVNNTKYANYAVDALDPNDDDIINFFQIDYRREIQKGDRIKVYTLRDKNRALIKGVNELGDIMFACNANFI